MVNLNNKNRLTKDIVVYENFLTPEESAKIIEVLDKAADNATLTWTPISFYESYSSTLPKEGDAEIVESGLPSDILYKSKPR